jgi:Glycosyl transferase family 11
MITVRLAGGLGNQMFQYAFGRSLSCHLNTSLKLDLNYLADRPQVAAHTFREFSLNIFEIDVEVANFRKSSSINHYIANPNVMLWKVRKKILGQTLYVEKRDSWFDTEVFNLKGDLYFEGNWQNLRYFDGIEDIVKQDFSFKNKLSEDLNRLADEIQNSESICLHVRRGDYVWQPHANKFNGLKGIDYFNSAVSLILQKLNDVRIYVFSDDIAWCVENVKFDRIVRFVEYEYPNRQTHEYFRLMTLCRHFVIANSTFSWWAAWLSQNPSKIVVAPEKWFEDSTIDTSDLIPESWIRI